jgi:hypothetical protein
MIFLPGVRHSGCYSLQVEIVWISAGFWAQVRISSGISSIHTGDCGMDPLLRIIQSLTEIRYKDKKTYNLCLKDMTQTLHENMLVSYIFTLNIVAKLGKPVGKKNTQRFRYMYS